MKTNKTVVVGRKYIIQSGQTCVELLRLGKGLYILAYNGQIRDARRKLSLDEAAEEIDGMKIRAGAGEDEDTGTVDRREDGKLSVRWDSLVVTPLDAREIDNLLPL